jgi:DNA-binding PucR family transcriptional regulator
MDPADAFRALDEARALLALVRGAEIANTDRATWDSLRVMHGAYFTDPSRMRDFAERTIGSLVRHDEAESGRLQTTFWAYQKANCNMNIAAELLETHRHTVANRLRRIRELTGLDPQRGYDRELLGLALRTHLVIENSAPPS